MYLPPAETGGDGVPVGPCQSVLSCVQAVKKPDAKAGRPAGRPCPGGRPGVPRRALRKQYIGYPELLQLPDFDVEAAFEQHIARLRTGPAKVTFRDSALALFEELKKHINDSHLHMWGAGGSARGLQRVPGGHHRTGAGAGRGVPPRRPRPPRFGSHPCWRRTGHVASC